MGPLTRNHAIITAGPTAAKKTPGTASAVAIDSLNYSYAGTNSSDEGEYKPALKDINLRIETGECVLLVGASGSGKSTCLRTMNALVPQFYEGELTGTVRVAGIDLATRELADMSGISAMVFQNPRTQFFTSSVLAELALVPENGGADPEQIRARIARIARQTGIEPLLERELHGLSGGELQRVACACALVAEVPLLLFDEPTSNLSPEAITEFRTLLETMRAQGKTLVIAEHRIHFLRGLIDRVYRLDGGRIIGEYGGEEFFSMENTQRLQLGLRAFSEPIVSIPAPPNRNDATGLVVENLTFSYGTKRRFFTARKPNPRVLNIAKMRFPAGKITVLTGPNGAGKSTLAHIICGLLKPGKGTVIRLNGRELSVKERTASSAIVMQDVRRNLFSESVYAEVTTGMSRRQEQEVNVPAILKALDVWDIAQQHPAAISGGQAQRLAIACAVAARKRLVIFDEPTSGVDLGHMQSIAQQMRALAKDGVTVICITHDAELMQACADYRVSIPKLEGVTP